MKKIAVILSAGFLSFVACGATEAQGVSLSTDPTTRRVTVSYSLAAPAIVTAEFLTNGVPIGMEKSWAMAGDVNKYVTNSACSFAWQPRAEDGGFEAAAGDLSVRITTWTLSEPPPYMVVRLNVHSNRLYYVAEEALPGGIGDARYRGDNLLMRFIPAAGATFLMGSPSSEAGRNPRTDWGDEARHYVSFSNNFYIGVFELTQWQMASIMPSHVSKFSGYADSRFRPVETFSGEQVFRGWRNNGYRWPQDGHKVASNTAFDVLRKRTGLLFDFPTEAQWEFAARAGSETQLPKGLSMGNVSSSYCANTDRFGWVTFNSAVDGVFQSHPVGLKEENGWGLYDVIGNVGEICLDTYDKDNPFDLVTAPDVDPPGYETTDRITMVVRGGEFENNLQNDRLATRMMVAYSSSSSRFYGVRLWCLPPEE